jgi:hypothetical protein
VFKKRNERPYRVNMLILPIYSLCGIVIQNILSVTVKMIRPGNS